MENIWPEKAGASSLASPASGSGNADGLPAIAGGWKGVGHRVVARIVQLIEQRLLSSRRNQVAAGSASIDASSPSPMPTEPVEATAKLATPPSILDSDTPSVNSLGAGIQLPAIGDLHATTDPDAVLDELHAHGWVRVPPLLPSMAFYQRTNSLLDEVLDFFDEDPLASAALDEVTQLWLSNEERCKRWCHTPPGWRDRVKEQGRPDKSYIQSMPGFTQLIRLSPSGEYLNARVPSLMKLLFHLDQVAAEATTLFLDVTTALDTYMPIKVATRIDTKPTVVVKALRYDSGKDWGTYPHIDKSALSLICWSDEPTGHLVVAPIGKTPTCKDDFTLVDAPRETKAATGATLLVGGTLERAGVQLPPSYHGVLPIESRRHRHSLIAFLLVPYLDVDDMETTLQIPLI